MPRKYYSTRELEPGMWPNPETPLPWTRLIGPGLDFHDVYQIGEKNMENVLRALEAAFQAGREAKADEIRIAIGARGKW